MTRGAHAVERVSCKKMGVELTGLWRDGGGRLVIFLHGLCGSSCHFDQAFTHLALGEWALFAPDLPGFGGSQKVRGQSLNLIVGALRMAIQELTVDARPWVVAHSMSSSIAARILDWVSGVVLVEGNLIPAHLDFSDRILMDSRVQYRNTHLRMQNAAATVMRYQTGLKDRSALAHYSQGYGQCAADVVWDTARACNADVRSDRPIQQFATFGRPLICLYGDSGNYPDTLNEVRGRLPGLKLQSIANSKHFPMIDNPEETYALVAEAIR